MKIKHKRLKTLHNKVWKLISEYVRRQGEDAEGMVFCFTCGKKDHWKNMDCGHYIHHNCLDYTIMNLKTQCSRCNRFLHGNQGIYAERLIAEYGLEAVLELRRIDQETKGHKFNIFELEGFIADYKEKLESLTEQTTRA